MKLRAWVLFLAVTCPALGLFYALAFSTNPFAPNGILERWQTLLAGAFALLAAWAAARPVWRQLDQINVQANAVLVEFLGVKIKDMERLQKTMLQPVYEIRSAVLMKIPEEDFPPEIDPEWAFDLSGTSSLLGGRYYTYIARNYLDSDLEESMRNVMSELNALAGQLETIHRPYSLDKDDPDYQFSEEDWQEVVEGGREAEVNLYDNYLTLSKSMENLADIFDAKIKGLRKRLRNAEEILLKSPG